MEPDVSIIVPNWNGGEIVGECLESIIHNTSGVDFEITVVDNGSTDDSPKIIRGLAAHDRRLWTIFNSENLLFARACNQGYEASRGRYILIANNDILLFDDAVSAMVSYADEHPEVGVVTPRFCDQDGNPQEFYRRLPTVPYLFAHYHRLGRAIDRFLLGRRLGNLYFYRDRTFDKVEEIEQPGASFSLFRRSLIEKLGMLFDEKFPLLFNDVDLAKRIHDLESLSHVVPDVQVVHLEGVSSRKFSATRYEDLQFRGMFTYFKKHHRWQYPLLTLLWPKRWVRTFQSPAD